MELSNFKLTLDLGRSIPIVMEETVIGISISVRNIDGLKLNDEEYARLSFMVNVLLEKLK